MGGSCEPNVQAEAACAVGQDQEACAVEGWTGGVCLAAADAVLGAVPAEAVPVAAGQLPLLHPAKLSTHSSTCFQA